MKIEAGKYALLEVCAAFTEEFYTGVPIGVDVIQGYGDRLTESSTYAQRVYAVYCDTMGGFPGLWQLCVLAAHSFHETHDAVDWGSENFIEAIHEYVFAIDEHVFGREDILYAHSLDPIGDIADEFPRLAKLALERSHPVKT